eukprot:jgi/Galph1/4946/GphlegSOOS_G3605.1
MTRHSKHNYDSAVFTYHEKKRMGYGSKTVVLGSETIKPFGCCCLSLRPSSDPVVTPEGYLYDKEAIIEHLLKQKKEIKKAEEENKEKRALLQLEREQLEKQKERSVIEEFEKRSQGLKQVSKRPRIQDSRKSEGVSSTFQNFWLPEENTATGSSSKSHIQAIRTKVTCCPMSGKPLRVKDLIDVHFTFANLDETKDDAQNASQQGQYICPVCYIGLTNAVKCAVSRTSGNVICDECVQRFVISESKDPLTGMPINPHKDIIYLQTEGTGYSSTSSKKLEQRKVSPAARV